MSLAARLLPSFVLAMLMALASASAATAAVTTSEITSLVDGQRLLTTGGETVNVAGDTDGTTGDEVQLICDYGPRPEDASFLGVVEPVEADGSFSIDLQIVRMHGLCPLHVVPSLPDTWNLGDPLTGFQGKRVIAEHRRLYDIPTGPNAGLLTDYYFSHQNERAYNDYMSVASCGLCDTRLTYPGSPANGSLLFWGNAALYINEGRGRAYAQIGGHNAYGAEAADNINPDAAGFPALSYTPSVDPDGNTTIAESQTFVRCPTDVPVPDETTCPNFVSTGVRLDRRMTESDGGTLVTVVDDWVNTTGEPQRLDLHYDQYFAPDVGVHGYQFPWNGGDYEAPAPTMSIPAPTTAPATIFVKADIAAADGSTEDPQGTITFSPAADEIHFKDSDEFLLGFDRTVPPGGTERIVQVFGIGSTRAELAERAARVEASLRPAQPQPQPQPQPPAKPSAKQASKLKVGIGKRLRVRKGRVTVAGTIARTATKRVRVGLRCGKTRIAKSVKPNRRGRWTAGLRLRGRCKAARKAALTVGYPGDATLRQASVRRKVTLVRPKPRG